MAYIGSVVFMRKIWKEDSSGWCILENDLVNSFEKDKLCKWRDCTYKEIEHIGDWCNIKVAKDRWVVIRLGGKELYRGNFEDCLEYLLFETEFNGLDIMELWAQSDIKEREKCKILEKLLEVE